jgi:hypothetical protein
MKDKDTQFIDSEQRLKNINKIFGEAEAKKFDEGKVGFSNVPRMALVQVAKVMTHGCNKYGKFNYSGTIESSRLTDALERHLHEYLIGKDIDESSYHHLAHVAANALMLLDNIITGKVIDDRNKVYTEC